MHWLQHARACNVPHRNVELACMQTSPIFVLPGLFPCSQEEQGNRRRLHAGFVELEDPKVVSYWDQPFLVGLVDQLFQPALSSDETVEDNG